MPPTWQNNQFQTGFTVFFSLRNFAQIDPLPTAPNRSRYKKNKICTGARKVKQNWSNSLFFTHMNNQNHWKFINTNVFFWTHNSLGPVRTPLRTVRRAAQSWALVWYVIPDSWFICWVIVGFSIGTSFLTLQFPFALIFTKFGVAFGGNQAPLGHLWSTLVVLFG